MNYTINEVSNQLINSAEHDHLSFFYKFELTPNEEFASIELNPYVDEEKARLMAANIIAEKIANKLIYHKVRDADTISRTVLSFSERHVETEEREVYEDFQKQLVKTLSEQQLLIDQQHKSIAKSKDKIKKQSKTNIALLSCLGLFVALNIYQFFN